MFVEKGMSVMVREWKNPHIIMFVEKERSVIVRELKNRQCYYVCRERKEFDGEGMKEPALITM